jgi:hypothetical protein
VLFKNKQGVIMVIFTPVINGSNQPQQAIPYSEIKRIERANGVTTLIKKTARGGIVISETLVDIKNQSMRNDMILVSRYNASVGAIPTQFLLPMERIKQLVINPPNRTTILFNDEDNSLVVLENLAQIQASNGQNLPTGDQYISSVSYPNPGQIQLDYNLPSSPLMLNFATANIYNPNTWFVDSESGDDNTAQRGYSNLPYKSIELAILMANQYIIAQGAGRQNVIVYAGKYVIDESINPSNNFLVRDGVDTYCHQGVLIRYINSDPNQCTEPFFDSGLTVISSFMGYAEVERYAEMSTGTRTTTNQYSEISINLKSYFGSAMQVGKGFKFWFCCDKYINPYSNDVAGLFVTNSFICDIKFKVDTFILDNSCSYVSLFDASNEITLNFEIKDLIISGASEIQIALVFINRAFLKSSNFFIGRINQLNGASYLTCFLLTFRSVIISTKFECADYNKFCGGFFDLSASCEFFSFLVKITGRANAQQYNSRLHCNQRVIIDLDVEIIDSLTTNKEDFYLNCHGGKSDIKPKITGKIKATNSFSNPVLIAADFANYPSQDTIVCLWNLQIFTDYTNITNSPSQINMPSFNAISNSPTGANTNILGTGLIITNELAL